MTQAASRGTRCTQCLCCDAVIVFEGEALCAACDEGIHPLLPESQAKASEPTTESRKVTMKRLTSDEIAAIQAAPASESTSALARRLGLNLPAVSYQRLIFQRKQRKAVLALADSLDARIRALVTGVDLLRHEALRAIEARKGTAA
jgi:hypothetical protein